MVACKDFVTPGKDFKQFAELKNSQIESSQNGYGTELTDEMIEEYINDKTEMDARVYVFPTSALKLDGKKINYFNYINSLENEDCNQALLRIFPKIDLKIINKIVDETQEISKIRKEFYKKIIKLRYENILKLAYNKLPK